MTPEIKKRIEQIRCGKVPEGYKKTKAGIIPRDWNLSSLDSFGKWVGGGTPSKDVKEYWENGTIPWISSQEVKSSIIDTTTYMITKKAVDESSTTLVPPNSIIVVTRSGILRHTFPVSKTQKAMAINQDIKALILDKPENVDFLIKVIEHNETDLLRSYVKKGTTVESVIFDSFSKYTIPIMESDEKFKITEILTTQDRIIALQQQKIEEIQRLKKACLAKMFPKKGSAVPEIRFPGFTDPWERRRLGDEMAVTSVKRILQSDWTDEGIRFLRARDIVSASKNEEPSDYLYISKEQYEEYSALSGKVAVGDLLVTGVGTIGIPYLISNSEPLYFKDGNIIWFQNEGKIDGNFLYHSFCGENIQQFIRDSAGIGTVGTYTIESGKKTPIFLPSKSEQQQIGTFFHNFDHHITLHERKLGEMQKFKKALMQLLLTGIVRVKI